MNNLIALVTGASSGIGLSTAKLFCEKGYSVISCDITDGNLQHSNIINHFQLDLTNKVERDQFLNNITKQYKGIDILVNNAGRFDLLSVEDTTEDVLGSQLDLNLKVPFILIKHFLPYMKSQRYGRFINVSSQKGLKGSPLHVAYCQTKHALNGLTKSIALETAQYGITCNSICPGWVATPPLIKEFQARANEKGVDLKTEMINFFQERKQPNSNIIQPDEIANSIYFLTTSSATSITGITLSHDNGNSID